MLAMATFALHTLACPLLALLLPLYIKLAGLTRTGGDDNSFAQSPYRIGLMLKQQTYHCTQPTSLLAIPRGFDMLC